MNIIAGIIEGILVVGLAFAIWLIIMLFVFAILRAVKGA